MSKSISCVDGYPWDMEEEELLPIEAKLPKRPKRPKVPKEIKVDIMVGDICRVKNPSFTHSTFYEFAIEACHPDIATQNYFKDGSVEVLRGKEVRVLFSKKMKSGDVLVIAETTNNSVYLKFVINTKGLEFVHSKDDWRQRSLVFIKGYLSGTQVSKTIPDEYICKLVMATLLARHPMDIQFVNEKLVTDDDYTKVLLKDGGLLGIIPEERRTLELCQIAVDEEPYAVRFVPETLRSLVKC